MKLIYYQLLLYVIAVAACGPKEKVRTPSQIVKHENFASEYVENRNVEIYLPPGYAEDEKYPVMYMHDGQNVFNPETSYTKVEWGVDNALDTMIVNESVKPVIVVAVWNTSYRINEYAPEKCIPVESYQDNPQIMSFLQDTTIFSDNYLKFIVSELKPFIDANYNTLDDMQHTYIMGSSMGGLISAYAMKEYPETFSKAGCLSTHWPTANGIVVDCLINSMPDPKTHSIYFDFGSLGYDSLYMPFQQRADSLLQLKGYEKGVNWETREFVGADHNEASWQARIHIPLRFLLK